MYQSGKERRGLNLVRHLSVYSSSVKLGSALGSWPVVVGSKPGTVGR